MVKGAEQFYGNVLAIEDAPVLHYLSNSLNIAVKAAALNSYTGVVATVEPVFVPSLLMCGLLDCIFLMSVLTKLPKFQAV